MVAGTALRVFVLLSLICAFRHVIAGSFNMSAYPKFPDKGGTDDPRIVFKSAPVSLDLERQLQHFHDYLEKLSDAERRLIEECSGRGLDRMTHVIREQRVLIWPEQFKSCQRYGDLLSNGDFGYEVVLSNLNKAFSAAYKPPRGDKRVIERWESTKRDILQFGGGECDQASRKIALSGTPGFSENPDEIFKAVKDRCPAEWVRIFQPEKTTKKKEPKEICPPGTAVMIEDDKSPTGLRELCHTPDEEDKKGGRKARGSGSKDDLGAELDEIKGGSFKQESGERRGPATGPMAGEFRDAIGKNRAVGGFVRGAGAGLSSVGTSASEGQLFGSEAGRALAEAARSVESVKQVRYGSAGGACADEQEAQASIRMQEARMATIERMDPRQKSCAVAKLWVDIYQRALAYAQRCNRGETIPAIQGEIASNQALANQECSSNQVVTGSSGSSSSIGSSRSSKSPGADSGPRCTSWGGSKTDPHCLSWSR